MNNSAMLTDVLCQAGDVIMNTGDCALMRMTCKEMRDRLGDTLEKRTKGEDGYVDGNGLSASASLARWALEHEIANGTQLWCARTKASLLCNLDLTFFTTNTYVFVGRYGACRRGDMGALAWLCEMCPDLLENDVLWIMAIMAGNVTMLEHLWANKETYPPKELPNEEPIPLFCEAEPEEWYTSVAIQWDRVDAFVWLRSNKWPVRTAITVHAVKPHQLETFNFLDKEYYVMDETVHAAIACGNVELVRRMVAPANGNGMDEMEKYNAMELLYFILQACLHTNVFDNVSEGETFVVELFAMGFPLTISTTIDALAEIDYTENELSPPFMGAIHGLAKVVRERGVRATTEEYDSMEKLVLQDWLFDKEMRPRSPAVLDAMQDLLNAIRARTTPAHQ